MDVLLFAPAEAAIDVEVIERDLAPPTGKGFGSLVHEVLATTDLNAGDDRLMRLARSLGRMLGNSDGEITAAAKAASRALTHPLLRRAPAAHEKHLCHRETPIVYRKPGGAVIEGAADSPWIVVDFKTDLRVDIHQEQYRRQVALYMEALSQATGTKAKGVLLYV